MKRFLILVISTLLLLSFSACSKDSTSTKSVKTTDTKNIQVTDKTVSFEKLDVSNIANNTKHNIVSIPDFATRFQTVEDITKYSSYIVKGTVKDTYFTVIEGMPYTVIDMNIDENIMGDLKENETITILSYGGYISVQQIIDADKNNEKFSDIPKEERKTTYYSDKFIDADFPKQGEEYVMCLMDSCLKKGVYEPVNAFESIFKKTGNEYVRTLPSPDYYGSVSKGETKLKNNTSFNIENFKKQCDKAKG